MSENDNYSLVFRYERFPPIQLLKSEKKASDIEKKLKVNTTNLQVEFSSLKTKKEQYQSNIKGPQYSHQPSEVTMTTQQLNESIQLQYERDIRDRHYHFQKYKDAVQADILQIQSEIGQMERKLKDEKDLEGIKTQKFRLEIVRRENSRLDYYINCLLYTSPSPRDRQKSRMPSSA
eukprot:TRINITY_DN9937_c0_g1_i1.p1 TRINITY_DN9937_c0_g1~~TRINITY_DN9937_c0_g1_i1.p1  ORF type:complete len:176 (+),score=27.60 TRINITY_DN9937_c0_g1_i1:360-887(+)